ncbi:MAG: hypothetical protein OSA40_01065 [Phycisphaerales bacterium]|nr:hypothetical protein [Phycisphaerales bacterium]
MYQSPLSAAHLLVMKRLLEHRREVAASASEIRGDQVDRQVPTSVELETVPWGVVEDGGEPACDVVLDFGELEAEYAAIRRATGIFDRVDRAVIELVGGDAEDLLERLVTNAFAGQASSVIRAFLLQRTGRVLSDLVLVRLDDRVLVELDRTDVARVVSHLEGFVFAEDVKILDRSSDLHRIDVLGPESPAVIESVCGKSLRGGEAMQVQIGEHPVTIFALDTPTSSPVGEPGIGVVVDRAHAEAVWEIVLAGAPAGRRPVRAIGWNAFNIARLEAGTPLFHLDFGPDALPHETGVLADRVSFTKGCYPGQEVVARMESRGKSKRRVVGLRGTTDALPITGAQIFDETEGVGSQVGVVTGSTIAPMRGAAIIAIASIRTSHVAVGTRVLVNAEGEMVPAVVTALDFELPGSPEPEDSEGAES